MTCPNCGTENAPGAKFCNECGGQLSTGCPSCGAVNPPGSKFCNECGASLSGASTAPAAAGHEARREPPSGAGVVPPPAGTPESAPLAERRLVSVLFADLVGFTALAADRDPEETRELLSRYFDLARDLVERYGGAVEKFIGDAVMAVWGAPVTREDDAERAVRAGLELVGAVKTLGAAIEARAGVLTGEAAVTIGAVGQGMVAGDLVNTASRLQSVAAPGTVLVGEATVRAADQAIAFEPAGEQSLKGKAAPVPAWRALRVVAERGGRNRRDTLEAPFVGRDDELRLLKELFHATSREQRVRLVSVVGPAGIGKSRLAWEFLKYIDGLVENVWWHDGRSPAYGEGITFWALGEMVRGRCGLLESDDEPTTRAKVARAVATHVPDEAERRWIEPALLALLGVESAVRSEELFGAWRTFFERLATTGPVVMVFEDFHFADPGLLDFVDHVLEWSRNSPIYVLTLARPELLDKRPDWGAGKRNFASVYLEPLPEPAMRELLTGLVPGLPAAAMRAIIARADGVPLYAIETIRMLVAQDRLRPDGAAYRPTGDLTELAVPDTLTALIAARLDGLPAEERVLVSDASVLGQSFTLAGLAAISGMPAAELEPHLRALVRRELLSIDADPRSPERGQYTFVQALIREVAYNTLAKRDRKARHLAAARFLEGLGSDEMAGGLAGHYLAAYRNAQGGPEADALAGQARIALKAAAERAAALGAHAQAVGFLEQALTVAADPGEAAVLHERVAASATTIMRIDEAEAHLHSALEQYRASGDRAAEARATAALGAALLVAYRIEPALSLLREASERLADLGDDPALARLNGQLARAYFLNDEDREALRVSDRVLDIAERSDLVEVVADTLITKGSSLVSIGRRYEGIGVIEAGRGVAAAHSLQLTVGRAVNNLASFLMDSDPRASFDAAREGIALARRLGIRSFQMLDNACAGAVRVGQWDWATEEVERVLGEDLDPITRAVALGDLVSLRAARGEPTATLLAELEAMPATGDTAQESGVAWARAWIAFFEGRFETARTEAHRAAELFGQNAGEAYLLGARAALLSRDAVGAREDLARVERTGRRGRSIDTDRATIEAGLLALEGHREQALAGYRESLRVWRDLGLVWDEALCAIDMVTLLGPDDPEVRAAAARAHEGLVPLRARPLIERLDAALSQGMVSVDGTGPRVPTARPAEPATADEAPA